MSQPVIQNRSQALEALLHPVALFLFLMLLAVRAFAGTATLAWDPVVSPSLAGYMLYYGPSVGNYTTKIDVGNTTTRAVSNLTDGATYHFVVTAYDASHVESAYSNDVAATIASTAVAANFTASSTSGVAPLTVNFTDASTGAITGYAWTFGDGATSTVQSPSHVYSTPGVFTVSLTISGSGGSNTKTMTNYITVNSPPDTAPPSQPSSLSATASGSTTVNLAWNTSTDNVGVTGYRIERCQGAGCTSFAQIATSTSAGFSDIGLTAGTTYSYRVRAADAAGNLSAYSNTGTATTQSAATPPTAAFSGSPTSGPAPLNVNFTSSSTGTIGTYSWNFGDGSTSTAQNPSHAYAAAGVYTVTLTVSGSGGSNTQTASNYVTVTDPGGAGAFLTGSSTSVSMAVDLTTVGTVDWVQWPGYVRKSNGGSQIGELVPVGNGTSNIYSQDKRTLSWRDGAPIAIGSSSGGISMSGTGAGLQIAAPADATTRTLTVYVAAQNTNGTFTAHLSDGSAPDYVQTLSAGKTRQDAVYTLTYRAASAGQRLTVSWTIGGGHRGGGKGGGNASVQGGGNVSFQGAALD